MRGGERLVAVGELVALRRSQSQESVDWAVDAEDAVSAELSAALSISRGMTASHLRYARALRDQLPMLGRALIAGDVLAAVDRDLALAVPRWGACNRGQLAGRIDHLIARRDRAARRRGRDRIAGRQVYIGDVDNGLAEITATLFSPDAFAVSERLTALAATACPADPRTVA